MTKLFDMAVEAVSQLSPKEQDEIAQTIFEFVDAHAEPWVASDSELDAIEELPEQAERGEFASAEQIRAVVAKYAQWRLGSW
jgi:hypothetical protein